jgi:hypothetical protein
MGLVRDFVKKEFFSLKKGTFIYFLVMLWNVFYIPLHVSFAEINFADFPILLFPEIFTVLFLWARAHKVYRSYKK